MSIIVLIYKKGDKTDCSNYRVKVKRSHHRHGVAQRVHRSIALLFHDGSTRMREWLAARPGRTLPPGKDMVPILQKAELAPGPVQTDGKSRPQRHSFPDRPARSQSLNRLSYPGHSNYSGISLLPTTYKIVLNILLSMLITHAEDIVGNQQGRFRSNSSITGHRLCIHHILGKKWEFN